MDVPQGGPKPVDDCPARGPTTSYTRQYWAYPSPYWAYPSPYPYQICLPQSIPLGYIPLTLATPPASITPTLVPPPGYTSPTPALPPEYIPPTFVSPQGVIPSTLATPPQKGFFRRGTTDWEPKKRTKRIRYVIPLRTGKRILDEENGFTSLSGASTGADSSTLRLPGASEEIPVQEQFDIVATQCIPDIEGREIISLTVKDKSDNTEYKNLRYESRWRYSQDHPV